MFSLFNRLISLATFSLFVSRGPPVDPNFTHTLTRFFPRFAYSRNFFSIFAQTRFFGKLEIVFGINHRNVLKIGKICTEKFTIRVHTKNRANRWGLSNNSMFRSRINTLLLHSDYVQILNISDTVDEKAWFDFNKTTSQSSLKQTFKSRIS